MEVLVILLIVVIIAQEIRLWMMAKDMDELRLALYKVIQIQKRAAEILEKVHRDLLEREAQYD